MRLPFLLIIAFLLGSLAQGVLRSELILSRPRNLFTSIEVDGKIYFAGGFENTDRASSTIDVFDIANQTWDNTLQLSEPRGFVTPVVVPPHIYFVGGRRFVYQTNTYIYNSGPPKALDSLALLSFKDPMQVSIFGTTLFVLGSFNAEFMDLEDAAAGWSPKISLDNVYQRIAGGIKFSHENLIFIVGGVNVSSREPVSDAWIYDITTDNLTRYENAVSPVGFIGGDEYSYSATSDTVAAWTRTGDLLLFNIGRSKWLNFTFDDIKKVISVPGSTFVFTTSGFYTVHWSNSSSTFTPLAAPLVYAFGVDDNAVYLNNELDSATIMRCTSDGAWTKIGVTPTINDNIVTTLDWPSFGHIVATNQGFYLLNDCSSTFITLERIQSIVLSYPLADLLYVLVGTASISTYELRIYNSTLSLVSTSTVLQIMPALCFDNVLIDFMNSVAVSVDTGDSVEFFNGMFGTGTLWTVKDDHFVTVIARPYEVVYSQVVDIYNYENSTWMEPTSATEQLGSDYNQAFNMNGVLGIFIPSGILSYDISNDTWSKQPFSPNGGKNPIFPSMANAPLVVEVNDTVYATTNLVQLKILADGFRDIILIGSDSEQPSQLIYHEATNNLFISTTQNVIYTWNIGTQKQDVFLFPRAEPAFFMATSGNFLLASSKSSNQFDYCDLLSFGWGNVTGVSNDFTLATMIGFSFNGSNFILAAGGYDKEHYYYTDSVRVLDVSSFQSLPAPSSPSVISPSTPDEPTPDNTTLIVAIVVPVGTVLLGGGLLAFFLIRRRNKKKKQSTAMSTMGLEQQYGQWFIPFTSLTFHEQLGQGASGQVFKGTWNNTTVALKLSMTQANNSVIDELTLMMQLRPHPNVVQLLGFSVHPETDSIVLVIEYCNQGALDDLLFNNKTSVTMKQKLEWLIGIAKGLSHLHSNNIVHRDVAARNVLMHQNEAKLTDFGMSRIVDSQQQRGTTKSELGPIRWMSPESLKSKEYSTKSDVWSFGIVAYEIITQQEPHADVDPIQIGQMIRDSGLTPQIPDTCQTELASLIKSCWIMIPSQRPSIDGIVTLLEKELSSN